MNDDGTQPVEPEWIRAAMRVTWDELRSYLRTLREVALRPRRFGAAWVSGSAPALNPLGFLATTLVVVAPAVAWFQHPFLKGGDPDSLVFQGFEAAEPFLSLVLMGLVAHPILRLAESKRRLRSTLAMALYAGAIPNLCLIPLSLSVRGFIGDVETTHARSRAWLYIVPGSPCSPRRGAGHLRRHPARPPRQLAAAGGRGGGVRVRGHVLGQGTHHQTRPRANVPRRVPALGVARPCQSQLRAKKR